MRRGTIRGRAVLFRFSGSLYVWQEAASRPINLARDLTLFLRSLPYSTFMYTTSRGFAGASRLQRSSYAVLRIFCREFTVASFCKSFKKTAKCSTRASGPAICIDMRRPFNTFSMQLRSNPPVRFFKMLLINCLFLSDVRCSEVISSVILLNLPKKAVCSNSLWLVEEM